ncbi:hypothetical protein [Gorillibacterium sp. sgz5001074]|uniref:hypothetical protein n=1 Tax=Gorillibacterium sp. sgz5001074 TaxID=3446695 RepID=UPI003F66E8C2
MADFILYMLFSILETGAMFILMFRIFKIDLLRREMLFSAVVMSFVSHTLRVVYGFSTVDVIAQFLLMFLFVWMLFRIHVFYAVIMTGMTYQAYFVLQTVYYFVFSEAGLFESKIPAVTQSATYILQFVSAASAVFIGWLLARRRKGFDFVPDQPRGRLRFVRHDWILLGLNVPSSAVIILTLFLTGYFGQEGYMVIPVLYALLLFGYLYISHQKDWNQDESFGL